MEPPLCARAPVRQGCRATPNELICTTRCRLRAHAAGCDL